MVTKKLARFSSYSRHCFFWHLFLGISVKILNVITFFRRLYALPLLYRWSFKSIHLEHLIHFCLRVNPHKCTLSERLSSEFGLVQVWFFHLPWFPRCKGNAKWAQHVRDVGFVFILFTFTSISDSLGWWWGGGFLNFNLYAKRQVRRKVEMSLKEASLPGRYSMARTLTEWRV